MNANAPPANNSRAVALDNPKTINFLSFQPVSFTGCDEEVTPERRDAQRYTLSHLAHDVKNQTGIGWRNIIEKMHMTATLTKWYEEHGRHEIFAGGKSVQLDSTEHRLKLNEEAVRAGAQTDMDDMGIAKNAREEKLAAQARKHKTPEAIAKEAEHNAEMAKLYAQHVLKEQPTLQIQGLGGKKKASQPAEVLHKPVV